MRQFRASTLEDPDQIGADSNVIDLKRYQHALSTKQKSRRSAASQQRQVQHQNQHQHQHNKYQHQPRFGKTLYNFQAKNEGELSLKCGDLVELLDILEGANWARVEDCQSGLQGLVPVTYLDCNIGCALAKRDVTAASWLSPSKSASVSRSSSSSRQSSLVGGPGAAELLPEIATTGASLAADKLLPMSKGEPIALIRKLSGHLYEASNTRLATGLVWSNDLEIIKQPPPPPPGNGGVEATQKTSGSTMGGNGLGRTGRVYPKKSGAAHAAHAAADYQQQMQMGGGGGDDVDAGGECFQDAELDSGNDEENCVHQEGLNVDIYGAAVAAADNDDDDDDDEISRYLNQLQSICTDLGVSKRRQQQQQQQHQQYQRFVTLDSNQVPLLVDSSSLAKRRRARSASAALDVQQQQQQLDQRERDHSSRDQRQQHYRSQTNQRHYEQKRDLLEQTSTTTSTKTMMTTTRNQAPGNGQQLHPYRRQQQQQQQPKQYRSSARYCACCKQEDDNLQQHEHEHEPTATACSQPCRADQIAGRQPARSLSSPHIVAASDRFQQQHQQQPEVVAAAPEALQAEPETAPMVTNTNLPRLCRARFAYKPRQRDELELIVGDILVVVQECDDGWFIGSSYTTKQMGTFPGNFVESI